MISFPCLPLDTPGLQFAYCPSIAASILFVLLFSLTMFGHTWQGVYHDAGDAWLLILSATCQTLAFIARCVSIVYPTNEETFKTGYFMRLLAPFWTDVFCVVLVARLVNMYMPGNRMFRMKGEVLVVVFVSCDALAFGLQLIGASRALGKNSRFDEQQGRDIYLSGTVLQQALILIVAFLMVMFLRNLPLRSTKPDTQGAQILTLHILGALSLITIRLIYCIIEYSGKPGNAITKELAKHEVWQYCLDTLPMFLAIATFHIYHPGRVFNGPDSLLVCFNRKQKGQKRVRRPGRRGDSRSEFVHVALG